MSDIKKIKDNYLNKLNNDLNIESLNQIKTIGINLKQIELFALLF